MKPTLYYRNTSPIRHVVVTCFRRSFVREYSDDLLCLPYLTCSSVCSFKSSIELTLF